MNNSRADAADMFFHANYMDNSHSINNSAMNNRHYFSDATKRALVSNKNVILYYYYLKNSYSHCEDEHNPCHLLFKDKAEEKFFLNKDGWCTLENYVNIVEKVIKITNNFEAPKIVGSLLAQYQKEYKLQEYKDAILKNIRGVFFGPVEIFKQISFFNYLFNKTKDMRFVDGKCGKCVIKIKFKDGVNPVFDYVSEMHIEGIFKSIFDLFNARSGRVSTPLKEYDLKLLVEEKFSGLKQKCAEENSLFFLGDEAIAEKVALIPEKIKEETFFLGKCRHYKEGDDNWAWRISKNVFMDKKYLVLKEGDIYNAPYFITFITWDRDSYPEILLKILRAKTIRLSPFSRDYAKLVHERLAQEQETAKLMAERQRQEKEFHQLLLINYIHPRFIDRAKIGLIPFKNIWVSNIFLDVHQSTNLRKLSGDEAFRKNRNIFLKLIRKTLHETAGEWGWLNKVMGDGCYIVFGAYNYFNDRQDFSHAAQAVNFAVKLINEIEQVKIKDSRLLADYYVRFGIETGIVEIGEAYEQDIEDIDQEISLGTLRIFDTDGHSVNIAKRIEQTARAIIKSENRSNKGGIFLGPTIINLADKQNYGLRVRRINLDELNISIKDYAGIKKIGEIDLENNN